LAAVPWVVIRVSVIVDEEDADAVDETKIKNKIITTDTKATEFNFLLIFIILLLFFIYFLYKKISIFWFIYIIKLSYLN
jgi:hypothetical protein